jgi:hypothetical protein
VLVDITGDVACRCTSEHRVNKNIVSPGDCSSYCVVVNID